MLGSGIIKGLAVTAKNFVGSFHDPARLPTIEYPEVKATLPENYRSYPFLVFDGEDPIDGLRCVACKMCENECPPQCIYIVIERDEKGRPVKKPKIFDIDISVCMSCQICVEVCPFDSIKMDKVFEITAENRFEGLIVGRNELAKSNTYYHEIRPTEAAEVDARLAEEKRIAEEKAKAVAAAKAAAAANPARPVASAAPAARPAMTAAAPTSNPAGQTAGSTQPVPASSTISNTAAAPAAAPSIPPTSAA
jgi:NADH-quinone oxidoreductase subunit I